MRLLWLSLLCGCLASPWAAAGTAEAPDLVDAEGDVEGPLAQTPCAQAIDLRAFWAEWDDDGLSFNYEFTDLSQLTTVSDATDTTGRCFYAYTDFEAVFANKTVRDSVYMDYMGSPAFVNGWRFSLQTRNLPLEGSVAGNDISVRFPVDLLANATPGDGIGQFRFAGTTSLDGDGNTYSTDWAPDASQPCSCWVPRPIPEQNTTTEGEPEAAEEESPALAIPLLLCTLVVAAARRRR